MLKINFEKNVHENELELMRHLLREQVPGTSKLIDHGEIENINSIRLSVQDASKYYFFALQKNGISIKDILETLDIDLPKTDVLKMGL